MELQAAIGQVRAIAMDLRPPSLDDMGLVATIDALCRDFGDSYPDIHVEQEITAPESAIPPRLKIVVYRIIEAALKLIGRRGQATEIRIALHMQDRTLALSIEDDGTTFISATAAAEAGADAVHSPLSAIHERTVISGGRLLVARGKEGGLSLRASWGG
jgi:signal transduction histidine kinase